MASYQSYPPQVPNVQSTPAPSSSGLATAAMVLGILGFFTCGVTSLLAVIFGHVGEVQTRGGRQGGRGQAVAGLIMGYIVLAPAIVLLIMMLVGAMSMPFATT